MSETVILAGARTPIGKMSGGGQVAGSDPSLLVRV